MAHPRTVLTIGGFDGVHVGHAALVARARALAGDPGRVVALSFDPHPSMVLRPEQVPARLTDFPRRAELLMLAGADEVIRLEPTPEFLSQTPEEFIRSIAARFAPGAVVEGADFRFGKGRAGDVRTLAAIGRSLGFSAEIVDPVRVAMTDQTLVIASSTLVRWLLARGRVRDAAIALGREYDVDAVVIRGDRRGRTIGFPTANLQTPCLVPGEGVYAGTAELPDGRRFVAAISIGTKPTFGPSGRALEAYLIDARPDGADPSRIAGLPEYGWPVRLRFTAWVRDQVRFDSVGSLVEQMRRDCANIARIAGWKGAAA